MPSRIDTRILDTAIRCFANRGYHCTTTKEIALAAHVTEGSLFRLFLSKENLFEEALKKVVSTQMSPEQFAELFGRPGNFRSVVQKAVRSWYDSLTPEYSRLAMHANLSTPELARDLVYKRVRNFYPVLADEVDQPRPSALWGGNSPGCARKISCSASSTTSSQRPSRTTGSSIRSPTMNISALRSRASFVPRTPVAEDFHRMLWHFRAMRSDDFELTSRNQITQNTSNRAAFR